MSPIAIRDLDEDAPGFDELTASLTDAFGYLDGSDLAETRRWARSVIGAPDETMLVAIEGRAIVGTVSVVACDLDSHGHLTPWLASLLVLPGARGRGRGASLVDAACAWARGRGHDRLHLYAEKPRVTRFYEALRWRCIEDLEIAGLPQSIMILDL